MNVLTDQEKWERDICELLARGLAPWTPYALYLAAITAGDSYGATHE